MNQKKAFIEGNFNDFCKLLPLSQQRALDRWLAIDDDDPKVTEIKEKIKLLLYNKRNIPIHTKDTCVNTIDQTNNINV